MSFQIDVVSITGKIFSGEALEVLLPGISGNLAVLGHHMPIVTPLTTGEVIVKTPKDTLTFSIGKGVFAFEENVARLLIEDVTSADEISEQNAIEAKRKAEELLEKGVAGEQKIQALNILRRSLVDLKIVRKRKKRISL